MRREMVLTGIEVEVPTGGYAAIAVRGRVHVLAGGAAPVAEVLEVTTWDGAPWPWALAAEERLRCEGELLDEARRLDVAAREAREQTAVADAHYDDWARICCGRSYVD